MKIRMRIKELLRKRKIKNTKEILAEGNIKRKRQKGKKKENRKKTKRKENRK